MPGTDEAALSARQIQVYRRRMSAAGHSVRCGPGCRRQLEFLFLELANRNRQPGVQICHDAHSLVCKTCMLHVSAHIFVCIVGWLRIDWCFLSVLSLIRMVAYLGWSLVTHGSMTFWLPFPCFVIRIWVVILYRLPVQLQERLCWLFAQQVLLVRSNFEHSKSITCEHFTSYSVFQIFTLHPVGISAV